MKNMIIYLGQVIIISGLLYGYYHFFLRNKKFHHYNRYYLLSATLLSLLIPFLNIPVYFSEPEVHSSFVLETLTQLSPSTGLEEIYASNEPVLIQTNTFNWLLVLKILFIAVASLFLLRFMISLLKIRRIIRNHPVEMIDSIRFVNTLEPGTPYSFFRWLFWHREIELGSEKGKQIFRHELFHINQKHSIDIIFMEIIFIIFFLNPFFWIIKKELRAIHEFLADRYAVSENNKWDYAELLLMQTLNTKQSLVNPFFHNQIKRRIAMITNSKKPGHQYLRKLMVLPLAFLAFLLFAFNYQYKNQQVAVVDKSITVVIDAGHGGTDAGAIAEDGTAEKDITLSLAKKIKELNKDENIRIILTRENDVLPNLKARTDLSNYQKADLFISLHVNSSTDKSKTSFEIINTPSKSSTAENELLASLLRSALKDAYPGEIISGTEKSKIWVLQNTNCPAVMLGCGYMSNEKELAFIKDQANQDKIATGILAAIVEFGNTRSLSRNETRSFPDTSLKKLVLLQLSPGKYGGSFDGIKIKEHFTQSNGSMVLMLENRNMIVLSKELSLTIFEKKGYDVTVLVKKDQFTTIDPSKIKFDADSKSGTGKLNEKPDLLPRYPGGDQKWRQWLPEKIIPSIPVEKGAPEGTYTVVIQFEVDKDGIASGIKALTNHGYGMEDEAIRVIKLVPKWEPAVDNQHYVKAIRLQPITFQIREEANSTETDSAKPSFAIYNSTGQIQEAGGTEVRSIHYSLDPRTLYLGTENIISIDAGSINPGKISATISAGNIERKENKFYIRINNVIENIAVRFYLDNEGKKEFIKEAVFKSGLLDDIKKTTARMVTPATPTAAGPKISVSELKNTTVYHLLQLPEETEIVSYTFTIDRNDDIVRAHNTGNQFSPGTIALMKEAAGGRLITIDLIKIKKDGVEKKIPSRIWYVTD